MTLRIGHLSTFYHTSILMIAGGADQAEREWRLFSTGPAIVHAFEKDEIDLAYIGLPPAIIGMNRGVDITCVAGGHVEGTVISGGRGFRGFPEIGSLDDVLRQFSGHTIGVPGKGSIHDVIISACLKRFGLHEDIQVRNYQWADEVLEAIHKGEVSAAVGTPALAAAVIRFADGRILYPPAKLWPNNPSYGILVKRDFLNNERALIEGFLKSHEEASLFLRTRPREAARIIAGYVGMIDESFVLDTLTISPKYCASLTSGYVSSTMEFVRILRQLGYINREISREEIFDTSIIDSIHPSGDHYGDGLSV